MGAPKQKWTREEEAALKAGVIKHGAGKWRTILIDPEFSAILHQRSNVDLKDKWRNINVTAIWGSRQKAKLALKGNSLTKHNDLALVVSTASKTDEEIIDAKPLAVSRRNVKVNGSKEPIARLDKLVIEAISNLRELRGSHRASISLYIEEHYSTPSNLNKLLSSKLKHMVASGKLVKVKHKYRIVANVLSGKRNSSMPLLERRHKNFSNAEKSDANIVTKSQVELDLSRMRTMTAEEAAAAAALAVAEAEIAIMEAEQAAKEAEAAEAEAEAAQVFAEAAVKALEYVMIKLAMGMHEDGRATSQSLSVV